jgi:3-dehydrotetronate 4-kinase
MAIHLGVIADDFTGATDVANNLVRAGMRVVQTIGVPEGDGARAALADADAVVIALKSRTAPVAQAVTQSLQAARCLQALGARQLYFKVCSTFDSTPRGNIGPVAEALMQHTGATFVPVTPAFPEAGRTVFHGHLFVGEQLLSDSPMRQHPLTPMTDANLVRVLQTQLQREQTGLIARPVVAQGATAIAQRAQDLAQAGQHLMVVDAVDNTDLHALAQACAREPLVVAASGLAMALPAQWGFQPNPEAASLPPAHGPAAVISGSCSAASNAQVALFIQRGGAAHALDPLALARGPQAVQHAIDWAIQRLGTQPVLVYATAPSDRVKQVQQSLGIERAGALVEAALAEVAQALVAAGVGRLVVAGGETSGACVQRLGVARLRIGAQIDPGVPWCHATLADGRGLHLALKSGNFGGVDFFERAFVLLNRPAPRHAAAP